jgi:uncharacterized membrane protein YhaH (DUF805 family)
MDLGHLYTSFDGRINRQPYWIGTIILGVVVLVISLVIGKLLGVSITAPDFRFKLVSLVLAVLLLYPAAALMVKRLHDRDRPAWFAALFLGPNLIKSVTDLIGMTGNRLSPNMHDLLLGVITGIVGIWGFVELGCLRGTVGTNQHGPDPIPSDDAYYMAAAAQARPVSPRPNPLPNNDAYYKKCPDCGKFTRGAKACRDCGHNF